MNNRKVVNVKDLGGSLQLTLGRTSNPYESPSEQKARRLVLDSDTSEWLRFTCKNQDPKELIGTTVGIVPNTDTFLVKGQADCRIDGNAETGTYEISNVSTLDDGKVCLYVISESSNLFFPVFIDVPTTKWLMWPQNLEEQGKLIGTSVFIDVKDSKLKKHAIVKGVLSAR